MAVLQRGNESDCTESSNRGLQAEHLALRAGNSVKYGPYKALAPLAQSPMRLHFPNNNPFAEGEYLEREIEVQHCPMLSGI